MFCKIKLQIGWKHEAVDCWIINSRFDLLWTLRNRQIFKKTTHVLRFQCPLVWEFIETYEYVKNNWKYVMVGRAWKMLNILEICNTHFVNGPIIFSYATCVIWKHVNLSLHVSYKHWYNLATLMEIFFKNDVINLLITWTCIMCVLVQIKTRYLIYRSDEILKSSAQKCECLL